MRISGIIFLMASLLVAGAPRQYAEENRESGDRDGIVLVFGGDVTLAVWYEEMADPEMLKRPFLRLKPYFDTADLVMVNCEAAITDRGTAQPKQFNFRMRPELVDAFPEGGVSLVTLANNHVCDYGREGLEDTIRHLDRVGVAHVGAGMDLAEARRPVYRTIREKKIAFLGYGNYAEAAANRHGTAYRHPEHVEEDVRASKMAGADIVVVNFHWGNERAVLPTDRDRRIAYRAIDAVGTAYQPYLLEEAEEAVMIGKR